MRREARTHSGSKDVFFGDTSGGQKQYLIPFQE